MKSYHEVEQNLLAQTPNLLKFDGYNFDHNLTLLEFIKLIFKLSGQFHTVTNNPNINSIICRYLKNRSLSDIYLLCKYYFPNTSLKEVRETLLNIPTLVGWRCNEISRYVYNIGSLAGYWHDSLSEEQDEFGWYPSIIPTEK